MLFPTISFVVFFLLVCALWPLVPDSRRARSGFIALASMAFYAAASLPLLGYLLAWATLLWWTGKKERIGFGLIAAGVLQLVFWKTFELFPRTQLPESIANWMVPLGVSFFTFQGLTYLFSRRNKELTQAWSLPEVVAFVAFFPTVFSGPIMRATSWEQQMARDPRANRSPRTFSRAMSWMCLGLFYKLVLSTLLGETVDAAWSEPSEQNPLSLWLAVYGYAFQLYTDFCGYSYLAASVALLQGFEVPQNFNRPYAALSVQDFWRRWHMSLSSWLRDYLYIGTLKGNARGKAHQVGNVIITFLLCGAWHGFALHYLIWGAWQAVGVAFSTVTKLAKLPSIATRSTVARIAGWFVTFQFIAFGWVWFRAPDTPTAWAYLLALFNTGGSWQAEHGIVLVTLTVAALCHAGEARLAASGDGMDSRRWPQSLQLALWTLALLAILAAAPAGLPPFIYFKY